jgi:hypothetical protein
MHKSVGRLKTLPIIFMPDIDPDEPLFSSQIETSTSSLEKFDQRMAALIEFAGTQYVSAEVRDECIAELEAAKKNGYKISKVGD